MFEVLQDTAIDSLRLLPFLLITYIIMETIEHHAGEKTEKIIQKSGKFGPVLGSILGIFPQCGFSTVAANFYAARIITIGTLISIFLSTSDEMLPILISEGVHINLILSILAIKVLVGMSCGIIIDILYKHSKNKSNEIHKICEDENCHCEEEGIIKSSIKHTFQIFIYIFIISLLINTVIFLVGEETISNFIVNVPVLGTVIAALIGVIPNCASSIILTELYIENILSIGPMIAGLLVNSGLGVLVLFKVNKNKMENIRIVGILFLVGIITGLLLDIFV